MGRGGRCPGLEEGLSEGGGEGQLSAGLQGWRKKMMYRKAWWEIRLESSEGSN